MVDFQYLLDLLYRIQGASDPNQPASTATERLAEIHDLASEAMKRSGYQPEDA